MAVYCLLTNHNRQLDFSIKDLPRNTHRSLKSHTGVRRRNIYSQFESYNEKDSNSVLLELYSTIRSCLISEI